MKLRNKKTGEVIDLDIADIKAQHGGISVIPEPVKLGGTEYVYYSLDGLVHEWEDYKPKEPLIKDEKIRKAVRAWADVLGNKDIHVFHSEDMYNLFFRSEFSDLEIQFDGSFEEQIKDGTYTIEELCGEEE